MYECLGKDEQLYVVGTLNRLFLKFSSNYNVICNRKLNGKNGKLSENISNFIIF